MDFELTRWLKQICLSVFEFRHGRDRGSIGEGEIFMNVDLAEKQKDIIKATREFAEKEFPGSI
jgi:hypothetical protein